jgi:hypothetical protein
MAFAWSLRMGGLYQIGGASTTIETTLRECARILVAQQLEDPRRRHPSQTQLDPRFRQQFKKWKNQDPASKPEHVLPNSTVKWLART